MKTSASSNTVSLAGGAAAIVAVAVVGLYLIVSAGKTEVTASEASTSYPTGVLDQEFGSTGVFMKTQQLGSSVNATLSTPPPVGSSELGKTDLGAYE